MRRNKIQGRARQGVFRIPMKRYKFCAATILRWRGPRKRLRANWLIHSLTTLTDDSPMVYA